MGTRRPLQERIQIVLLMAKFENAMEVMRCWRDFFQTEPPARQTITSIYQKFKDTGSIADEQRSGRPRTATSKENLATVQNILENDPTTTSRVGSLQAGMSQSSFIRAAHELDFSPYRPQRVQELSDDDFDRRMEACEHMLELFNGDPRLVDKVLWSDESEFRLDGTVNRHNCVYWATANPGATFAVPHTQRGVMVWCAMTSTRLIGPYFFEGSVNSQSYLTMLSDFLWPQISRRRLIFQQDGASAHYAVAARRWLDEKMHGRWIGRRGPYEWPARSPDLTPCDFYLWGRLKTIVYRQKSTTLDELREKIRTACAQLSNDELARACQAVPARMRTCVAAEGRHVL